MTGEQSDWFSDNVITVTTNHSDHMNMFTKQTRQLSCHCASHRVGLGLLNLSLTKKNYLRFKKLNKLLIAKCNIFVRFTAYNKNISKELIKIGYQRGVA